MIIIGAGPAGLSCALELHDSKVNYVVFEKGDRVGGQLWDISNTIRNFIGGFDENGSETALRLAMLTERMSTNIVFDSNIQHLDLKLKMIRVKNKTYSSKAIVIATGYRVRELSLPGISIFSSDVFYHSEGKEADLAGCRVAVIGGGDMALGECLGLAEICPEVFLIHRNDKLKARPDVIASVKNHPKIKMFLDTEVDSLIGKQRLSGLQVISSRSGEVIDLPVQRVLIKIGYAPNTEPFRGQVNMDNTGHILIDRNCESNLPGIFAIGDITNPGYPRIATAAGHGITAGARIRAIL